MVSTKTYRASAFTVAGLVIAISLFFLGRDCEYIPLRGGLLAPEEPKPELRLAIITDLKGYLEPCGCTSRPLGGIDRMVAAIGELRKEAVPLLLLLAGDTFFDGSARDTSAAQQESWRVDTLAKVLAELKVDAIALGPHDNDEALKKYAEELKLPLLANAAALDSFVNKLRVDKAGFKLDIATVKALLGMDAQEGAERDFRIGLIVGSRRVSNDIATLKGIDFVVRGGLDEEKALYPNTSKRAVQFHAGRQGQGLLVIDLYNLKSTGAWADVSEWTRKAQKASLADEAATLQARIRAWEASKEVSKADLEQQRNKLRSLQEKLSELEDVPAEPTGRYFKARWQELPKDAPQDPATQELLSEYFKRVNEHNRVALADLKPPKLEKGQAHYVGSQVCASCHQPAYQWWQVHPHGRAYQTLVDLHKEYNLDCVGCHVTGYGKPGGSTVTHNLDGALVNVGCENCHGPGSQHAVSPRTANIMRQTTELTCVGCHNKEHSDKFDYDLYRQALIVPGHGLPVVVAP